MKPKILPSAIEDLEQGRDFYDAQDQGVGDQFLECAIAEIESLNFFAGHHGTKYGYHRMLVSRFPFIIYGKVEGSLPVVCRVLDARSHPRRHRCALG